MAYGEWQRICDGENGREVIKIWCEVLDRKDKSKYRNGGVWEMINGDPRMEKDIGRRE